MRKLLVLTIVLIFLLQCQAQYVGIGTSTPLEKLHIAGNLKADTLKTNAIRLAPNAGAGKILTSDANGNDEWMESGTSVGVAADNCTVACPHAPELRTKPFQIFSAH
jgi:hypothetical protein